MTPIFVFGSNLSGIHGCCAAKYAHNFHGALMGIGEGPCGDSYAIPTKDRGLKTLPLYAVQYYINRFLAYARNHSDQTFRLTAVGCGQAGYRPDQIAPMFVSAPMNVLLPDPTYDLMSAEFTRIILEARNQK